MVLNDVDRLIREGKIVACNISDLQAVNMIQDKETKKYKFIYEKIKNDDKENMVVFLYKKDNKHYIEQYSNTIITVLENEDSIIIDEFEKAKKSYKKYDKINNLLFILKSDLHIVDDQQQAVKFSNLLAEKSDCVNFIKELVQKNKINLQEQYNSLLASYTSKEKYVADLLEELKDKEVYIVDTNDIRNVRINDRFNSNNCTHYFYSYPIYCVCKYTLLIKVEENIYEEYYSKIKINILGEDCYKELCEAVKADVYPSTVLNKYYESLINMSRPTDIIQFYKWFKFLLEFPFYFSKVPIPNGKVRASDNVKLSSVYDFNEKNIREKILPNFGIEKEIAESFEIIKHRTIATLQKTFREIKLKEEEQAYAYNNLVDIALRLRKENNTED